MALQSEHQNPQATSKEMNTRRRTPLYNRIKPSRAHEDTNVSCPDDSDEDLDVILRRVKEENERKYGDFSDPDCEIPAHVRMQIHNRSFFNSPKTIYAIIFISMAIFLYFVQVYNMKQLERLKEKYGLDVKKSTPEVWWRKTLFYYVYIPSFKDSNKDGFGDINGLRENLNHLVYLGVEAVVLSSMNEFAAQTNGHEVTDFKAIDSRYGTMEDFDNLIKDIRERGMKLIVELIPNHTSRRHRWFAESCKRSKPYKDYYIWHDGIQFANGTHRPPNNWRSRLGGSAWSWNEQRGQFYYHYYGASCPDLNHRNPDVRQEMISVLQFWLEKGIDGFRIDSPHVFLEADDVSMDEPPSGKEGVSPRHHDYLNHIFTEEQLDIHEFLASWGELVDMYTLKYKRKIVLLVDVATDSVGSAVKYYYTGADAPFSRSLLSLDATCDGRCAYNLIESWLSHVPDEKDVVWMMSDINTRLLQAKGSRYTAVLNMLLLLLPGAAVTYYGEEIGMQSLEADSAMQNGSQDAVWQNSMHRAHSPMQWSRSPRAGFTESSNTWCPLHPQFLDINVETQKATPHSLLRLYRSLAEMRKQPAFRHGHIQFSVISTEVVSFIRFAHGATPYLVALNVGTRSAVHDYTLTAGIQFAEMVLHGSPNSQHKLTPQRIDLEKFSLEPGEGAVIKLQFDLPQEPLQ